MKYLLGTAAVALFAATGAARAADVMPIVVATTPAVVPVAVGPIVTVQTETRVYIGYYDNYYFQTGLDFDGEINVLTASGWGLNVVGDAGLTLYRDGNNPSYVSYGANFRAELYRVIGNAEVGFFIAPYGYNPLNIDFGPTFRFESDRIEFRHETEVSIYSPDWWVELKNELTMHLNERLDVGGHLEFEFGTYGRYFDLGIETEMEVNDGLTVYAWGDFDVEFGAPVYFDLDMGGGAELDVTERLTLEGWADIDLLGGFGVGFGGEATLHLGPISPFVYANWYSAGGLGFGAGLELEHPIGTGPLTLIGDAGVNIYPGGTPDYYASIGIRFNRGDAANLLYTEDDGDI